MGRETGGKHLLPNELAFERAKYLVKSHRYFLRKTFLYKYSYILQLEAKTPVYLQSASSAQKNPIETLFEWILARNSSNLFSNFLAKTHDGSIVGGCYAFKFPPHVYFCFTLNASRHFCYVSGSSFQWKEVSHKRLFDPSPCVALCPAPFNSPK